jgi:hypothetical protein
MTLTIELTPEQQRRLEQEAAVLGPAGYLRSLLTEEARAEDLGRRKHACTSL